MFLPDARAPLFVRDDFWGVTRSREKRLLSHSFGLGNAVAIPRYCVFIFGSSMLVFGFLNRRPCSSLMRSSHSVSYPRTMDHGRAFTLATLPA